MPLDEYKTQVLLLHSEQSALDNLSSGFNDLYTVHCVTSGSEALNTLVETPINVIISAHDLPGMSGLDALREAKKRSPDTIGILLAGDKTSDIEALVSEEEVFQVVSGAVTGDGLLKLVENATRQMRLMALAESANDTTASVDMSAEHVVVETSENGSTIISDGTGRMPLLDPKKVAAAVTVGPRAVDILVLTKDQEFLETIKDSSRGMHRVYYANTLGQANEAIRKHKIGVAVVDAAMVGEKIEQLTQHLRMGSPRLVSIVAGRRDDGEMLMDLINRGKVYRFLMKPVSPGRARLAVESSVKHHLEAPDAAFKSKGIPAATQPAAKPAPKPVAKPVPVAKPGPKPVAKAAPKPAPEPSDPPTVTRLIRSISKKFSSNKKSEPIAGVSASLFRDPRILGFAATAVVVTVSALFWFMSGSDEPQATPPAETLGTPSFAETDVVLDEAPLAAELDAVIGQALGLAESAMLESRLDDSGAALQRVATVDPQNARLPFLNAQLAQMRLRGRLDAARVAVRENRFEDAASALNAARNLDVSDTTEIDTIAAELSTARSEQQVDDVLARAADRLDAGDLLSPANDNARYYYELVLSNDSGNTAARQGLSVIAGKLAFQAEAARQAEADRQAEAERLAAESQTATSNEESVADAEPQIPEAAQSLQPAPVSSLNRIKYVAPKYPRAAQRRNLSGWVDVVFIVTTDGSVRDVAVRTSEPGDAFVNAAIKAVEKWEFEPVVENGTLIEKLVGVRMMFALE